MMTRCATDGPVNRAVYSLAPKYLQTVGSLWEISPQPKGRRAFNDKK